MSSINIDQVREVIGEEATNMLVEAFKGKYLYIRKNNSALPIEERNKIIKNLYQSGRSPAQIAEKVDLSIEHVKKIIYKR